MPLFITVDSRDGKIASGIIADDLETAKDFLGQGAMEAPSYAVPDSIWRYDKEKNEFFYETPDLENQSATQ